VVNLVVISPRSVVGSSSPVDYLIIVSLVLSGRPLYELERTNYFC